MDAEAARSCRYLEDLCHGMQAMRKPLLAAVNGHAVRLFLFFFFVYSPLSLQCYSTCSHHGLDTMETLTA